MIPGFAVVDPNHASGGITSHISLGLHNRNLKLTF